MNMGVSQGGLFTQGTLIANRYEVVSVLGTGAMGTVVRVIDRALDNEVCALKLLHPHQARDKTSFARFRNEVILARRLGHPHIARLYDIGLAGGGYYYISMEYIAGGSLNQVIYQQRRETLVFRDSLRMLCEIADGIAYAHTLGVVHRDLKPENILIGDRSEVKITDFGLARSLTADRGFTDTGETVGTPCYMAPEQLRGERVDGRCDIYALGIIAYELTVGRRPFFDESYFALAAMHMKAPIPDFATKESGIPKWFEDFVKKCAAKDPADRYQDAYAIVDELRDRLRNRTAETEMRRAPAVMSFYAPTRKQRGLPSALLTAFRWVSAAAILGLAIFFALWMNGVEVSTAMRGIGGLIQGNSPVQSSPAEIFTLIESGDEEKLRQALKLDPKLVNLNYMGETPLMAAARTGRAEVVTTLLEARANPDLAGSQGRTPLMSAAERPGRTMVELLLNAQADPNLKDDQANTALIYAVKRGNASAAETLMEHAAMVNSRNEKGQTALFEAVIRKDFGMVQVLLSRNSDPNVQDSVGRTPLSYAAEMDEDSLVRALMQKGADPNLRDLSDRAPSDYAGRKSRKLLGSNVIRGVSTPEPTANQQAPQANANGEMTRLRSVGDIGFVVESTPAGPRSVLRGNVKNFGSTVAKQVVVSMQTPDGRNILLAGPTEIEANGSASYTAAPPEGLQRSAKLKLLIQCGNCWK